MAFSLNSDKLLSINSGNVAVLGYQVNHETYNGTGSRANWDFIVTIRILHEFLISLKSL